MIHKTILLKATYRKSFLEVVPFHAIMKGFLSYSTNTSKSLNQSMVPFLNVLERPETSIGK